MRVLIACEFSGIVRDAFKEKGHDAWSCDLLPTEKPGQHIQGDVLNILNDGWDLMIAHPPCTYLSHAGIGWFNEEKYGDKARERKIKRGAAVSFFINLYNAPINKIAIENPIGHMNGHFRKPDQIIQPYYFGEPQIKAACLWLKNLPILVHTNKLEKPEPCAIHIRKPSKYCKGGEIKKRYFTDGMTKQHTSEKTRDAHVRSRTFQGIADAMADQWG
jgi:hypothetical protein